MKQDTPPISHQTVKLARGSHRSPEEGACVMELASMLAGERFSDRPQSVCPVIGAVLRTYNDLIGDRRRQDLYPLAAMVVGSRADEATEAARVERCLRWTVQRRAERSWPWRLWAERPLEGDGPRQESFVRWLTPLLRRTDDRRHAQVVALVEELLALGPAPAATPMPPRSAAAPVAAPTT